MCVNYIKKKKNSSSFPDFTAHKNHISGSGKIEIAIGGGKEWERVRNRGAREHDLNCLLSKLCVLPCVSVCLCVWVCVK